MEEVITMLSCKEVAGILSREALAQQPLATRIRVRAHLWMCRHCEKFARQLRQLGKAARSMQITESDHEQLEDNIIRKLSERH